MSTGLRERKKQQTRQALFAAALRLFATKGYHRTTVAEIAAEAGVSTKTLFNHVGGKEEVLFAFREDRIEQMLAVVRTRRAGERPAALLGHVVERVLDPAAVMDEQSFLSLDPIRIRLITTVPELRARSLQLLQDAQRRLAGALCRAYPDKLDPVTAAAAVGALFGAMQAAALTALDDGASARETLAAARRAADLAARGLATLD
ncbi:DNA-binding transcriptional regulator, AcrR family [Amycolatopsis arida]|uniref:DNA-binding transcriptional regulator, AcrR family n=1 Tax=Amycolatopsis arida TaxID=587909 RepID=A0A1I5UQL2_9PSEU|nr:TetR/AcrR family transcriptional regulator [Amycolatopsis arida]TDX90997.1 AcrR family transcriptional regulator [Amycolatopsis arida]SFP97512.1 DNA-binding transcriptional regulator, AcrR family [Amycolatopsis arida]